MDKTYSFLSKMYDYVFAGADWDIPDTLYFSLHTQIPGATSLQNTNEIFYANYSRIAMPTVTFTNGTATFGAIQFPTVTTQVSQTALGWGIGTDATGAGDLWFYGSFATNQSVQIIQTVAPIVSSVTLTES